MKYLIVIACFALGGCLSTDVTEPGQSNDAGVIQDQNLLAGATSSTNWPQEDGGRRRLAIKGKSQSGLTLYFKDTTGVAQKMTGIMRIYPAESIPAFASVKSVEVQIRDQDSLVLSSGFLRDNLSSTKDTVAFSLFFEIDSLQSLLTGFVYSKAAKDFLKSPFSMDPDFSSLIVHPHYSIHVVPDSGLPTVKDPVTGKMVMCFYIPGSPFFFKADRDTAIDIGPLPIGKYPIRIIRITEKAGETKTNLLEVFEALITPSPIDAVNHYHHDNIKTGKKLFEAEYGNSISIRSDNP